MDRDSVQIDFKTQFDTITNTYAFSFDKTEDNAYRLEVLPEAFTDFFDNKNDTINYSLNTKKASDFGYARFTLVNATYPLIIQLTDKKGEVKYEAYAVEESAIDFLNLNPGIYLIRIIHDTNGNKEYDTGSFLKKRQPENVSFFQEIEIRADWGGIQEVLEFK